MDRLIDGQTDIQTVRKKGRQWAYLHSYRWIDVKMDTQTDGQVDGCKNGWTEGETD